MGVPWRSADLLDRLSGEFAETLAGADVARAPPVLVGAEHEYRVVDRASDGSQLDFRTLVHSLRLGRPRLDPDDPYAYRLPSGHAVTCDEAEAEIALAPVEAVPGFAFEVAAAQHGERQALQAALPPPLQLEGHSTHLSVSVPTALGEPVGRLVALAFGSDLVRLVDSSDRCGIWVRPRPDRLELCTDFIEGDRLRGAAVFALAAVAACHRAVAHGEAQALPPLLAVNSRPAGHRPGWNLARRSFGGDPFGEGPAVALLLSDGGRMPARDHLAAAWRAARPLIAAATSCEELALVDVMTGIDAHQPGPEPAPVPSGSLAPAFGNAVRARARPGYEIASVALTWRFAVFVLLDVSRRRGRRAFVGVPGMALGHFLSALDGGALDGILRTYLRARPTGRALRRAEETSVPGLFDQLGLRRGLLPAEPALQGTALDIVSMGLAA